MPIEPNDLAALGSLGLFARGIVEGFVTGLHKSPFHGFSVEFAEHRLYNSGEPIRNVDWKLYAKTDKLFVKRYEDETNLRCRIVIDQSSSMRFPYVRNNDWKHPDKLTFSVLCAASLIELMRRQHDAVGLDVFDKEIVRHTADKTASVNIRTLFSMLEELLANYDKDNRRETAATACLHQIAEMSHKRSLVVIFSDMFDKAPADELFAAIEHLRYNKHEVILFNVHDEILEQNLGFDDKPHTFIDLESGESLRLNPADVRQEYAEIMAERKKNLVSHCLQYQVDCVDADINEKFDKVLTAYLVKRNSIR